VGILLVGLCRQIRGLDTILFDHSAQFSIEPWLTANRRDEKKRPKRCKRCKRDGGCENQVYKRLDVLATALFHDMKVAELSDLDLSYTPPLSSPWDPVQMAAQAWSAQTSI
jgi:hypothetical protein